MKVLVTGATGFIGQHLCKVLANNGITVHALYRSEEKAQSLLIPSIQLFKGEVSDKQALKRAMDGCEQVYHVAAFAKVWDADKDAAWKINVAGTDNVLEVARECAVKRIVFTSTAGVYGASPRGVLLTETSTRNSDNYGDYERSKVAAEKLIHKAVSTGLEVVIVHPTRVFGPGLLSESNSVTKMIASYITGKWHVLPGSGKSSGNYVFVDDVVNGHILAMQNGKPGESYILSGENISYVQFFNQVAVACNKQYRLFRIPLSVMLLAAGIMDFNAFWFGIPPKITRQLVRKFNCNWELSSKKAEKELGYNSRSFNQAISETVKWIKSTEK